MKIKDCNDAKLAVYLKKLSLVSMQLGHAKVHGTVRDYLISSEDNIELDFICDLFTVPTEEIIEKWYGGKENALRLIQELDRIENMNNYSENE